METTENNLNDAKLNEMSKEELIRHARNLQSHVSQLRNIIAKQKIDSEGATSKPTKQQKPKRVFDFSKCGKRHIALKLLYLGWDYQGFAVQEDTANTIEHHLFEALLHTKLIESRETSNYHRCGRTDKGVSAFSQVISIDVRSNAVEGVGVKAPEGIERATKDELRYVNILNKVLPAEIQAIAWAPVDSDFSARFNCKQRTYRYYFPRGNLDVGLMTEAANHLVGEHDFRNLCKMDVANGVTNFKRKISCVDFKLLKSADEGPSSIWQVTIVGQAYLWHQIRCILAVLFLVGQKKESPSVVRELLDVETNPCKPQYSMASELPLVLFDCEFENLEWQYDVEALKFLITRLQETWTTHSIRTSIVGEMLGNLENVNRDLTGSPDICSHCECLTKGSRQKVYNPLLQRQQCRSLDDRIEHYAKKRRKDESSVGLLDD